MHKICLIIACIIAPFQLIGQTINWLTVDFAPYYINTDDIKIEGRDRAIIEILAQQLPNFSFTYTQIPGSRLIHELANQRSNVCFLSLYKTPHRLKLFHFSTHPSTIGLAPTLMMKKSTALKLKLLTQSTLSLAKVMVKHDLLLGMTSNRSFGKHLDSVIKSIPAQQQIARAGDDVLDSLITMLHKNRVDVLLGYPDEQLYLAKQLGVLDEIVIFSLEEAPTYSVGYIGCSHNDLGKENIKLLDQALLKIYPLADYYQILTRWLPDNLHKEVKKMLTTEVQQYGVALTP